MDGWMDGRTDGWMDGRKGWNEKREKPDTVGVPQPTSDEKLPFNLVSGVRTRPSAC